MKRILDGNKAVIGCFLICIVAGLKPICAHSNELCKRRASFYTAEKVAHAAENIRRYDWAREQKDRVVARADKWLANVGNDLGQLWDLLPSQAIPRSFAVNSLNGCLACKGGINKFGNYSYLYDRTKMDWKLTCPNCHR